MSLSRKRRVYRGIFPLLNPGQIGRKFYVAHFTVDTCAHVRLRRFVNFIGDASPVAAPLRKQRASGVNMV